MPAPITQTASQIPAWLRPPTAKLILGGGVIALWLAYASVFMLTAAAIPSIAFFDAAANVLPLAAIIACTHALLRRAVMPQSVPVQAVAHLILGVVFALTWYGSVVITLALFHAAIGEGFRPSGFSGRALTWQIFQGLVLYVTVAAVCYAIRGARFASDVTIVNSPPLRRYLVRTSEEIVPINVREIATITGAQDYCEVAIVGGARHLVRMSLAEFGRRLDPEQFMRIHRSTIINFDHLDHAEPTGDGRLLAHMRSGDTVRTSRAGAQLLRELIV